MYVGDVGSSKKWPQGVCCKNAEEGCHTARRWCGSNHDREESADSGSPASISYTALLLLSDYGKSPQIVSRF